MKKTLIIERSDGVKEEFVLTINRKLLIGLEKKYPNSFNSKGETTGSMGDNLEKAEYMFYLMLKVEKPDITEKQAEEIANTIEDIYGASALYNMIQELMSEVFTKDKAEKKLTLL